MSQQATGAFDTDSDGDYEIDSDGDLVEITRQEIDFFDRSNARDAYRSPNRSLSDLWYSEQRSRATSGAKVFHIEGYNVDGSLTPHSAASLPRSQDSTQYAYLPYYPRPGDRMALDTWFLRNKSSCKTQFHFGGGGSAPEYGDHLVVGLDNPRNGLVLGRETEQRGGYVVYDKIPFTFDLDRRYSPIIDWHNDGHFTVYLDGRQVSTRGSVNNVPVQGRGIGYECGSGNVNLIDTVRLV